MARQKGSKNNDKKDTATETIILSPVVLPPFEYPKGLLGGGASETSNSDANESVNIKTVDPSPAQAYAMKVWSGQSIDLSHGERVSRVKKALNNQGFESDWFHGLGVPK